MPHARADVQNGDPRPVQPPARSVVRDRPVRPAGAIGRADGGGSAGGPCDVGGDDVGGVAVQGCPGPVIAHGGPGVGVRGGVLHVVQRHPDLGNRARRCRSPGSAWLLWRRGA